MTHIEYGEAPGQIQRINQQQVYLIAGTLNEDANLSNALAELETIFQDIALPQFSKQHPKDCAPSS